MLEACESASERWSGVSILIERWLKERKALLVSYCSITGTDKQNKINYEECTSLDGKLKKLCQILVDYVSVGHFEIFDNLQKEVEAFGDESVLLSIDPVFQRIQQNTEACLFFNDKCESLGNIHSLQRELSSLGEILAERFELEDKLLEIMHYRYEKDSIK